MYVSNHLEIKTLNYFSPVIARGGLAQGAKNILLHRPFTSSYLLSKISY